MYSLNSITQAGAANAYSHLFFVLFAINEAKNHLMVFWIDFESQSILV